MNEVKVWLHATEVDFVVLHFPDGAFNLTATERTTWQLLIWQSERIEQKGCRANVTI